MRVGTEGEWREAPPGRLGRSDDHRNHPDEHGCEACPGPVPDGGKFLPHAPSLVLDFLAHRRQLLAELVPCSAQVFTDPPGASCESLGPRLGGERQILGGGR